MNRSVSALVVRALGLAATVALVTAVPVSGDSPQVAAAGTSVVSLLSPAHGSAFAYGPRGQLVTTRQAVAGLSSVGFVTSSAQHGQAAVRSTSDPRIVVLQTTLDLTPLRRGTAMRGAHLATQAGPLDDSRRRHGVMLDPATGKTSSLASSSYAGSPILNKHGRVVGAALIVGRRLVAVSPANLVVKTSARALPVLAIAAVALLVTLAGAAVMLARGRRRRLRARRTATTQASDLVEPVAPVQVSLRRQYAPDPDVRLNRSGAPDDDLPVPAEEGEDTRS
jgi:hypothetical protein